jgi:hypothetical protein
VSALRTEGDAPSAGPDSAHCSGGTKDAPPPGSISRLVLNVRTQGLAWLRSRLDEELTVPRTGAGKKFHALSRRALGAALVVPRHVRHWLAGRFPDAAVTLFAFYDLKVSPITFDFLWFLVGADLHRRRSGLKSVHLVIVPGPYDGLRREREDYEQVIDAMARQARIYNILAQSARLLPSCAGLTVAASRAEASALRSAIACNVFPTNYEPLLPVHPGPGECLDAARCGDKKIGALRAPAAELRGANRWAEVHGGDRRLVTISLRNYSYMSARNSNIPAWAEFARSLDSSRYVPVFIPDTDDTIRGMPRELNGLLTLPEAAWNVALRMALYERAFLNLGVNTGPMGMCWLNERTRYASLKMEAATVPQTTLDYFRELGFEPGGSLPFATSVQEWVWEDDTSDAIKRTFERLVERIENQLGQQP